MDISLIVSLLQGLISNAPQIYKAAADAVAFVEALFSAKLITADQQNALHDHVDAIILARLKGEPPPHWQVEPDPA